MVSYQGGICDHSVEGTDLVTCFKLILVCKEIGWNGHQTFSRLGDKCWVQLFVKEYVMFSHEMIHQARIPERANTKIPKFQMLNC